MIVETCEQLERIFFEVKPAFPEIDPQLKLFPRKQYENWLIGANVHTGDICWRTSILGKYRELALRGLFAHEFGHLVRQNYMRHFSEAEMRRDTERYNRSFEYRRKIEREADSEAVLRGFGAELYSLTELCLLEIEWKETAYPEHLSLEEIRELMKN